MGVYLSGLTLVITVGALMDTARFQYMPDLSISPAMVGLAVGIAFAVAARIERYWVPVVMVPLGILATLASVLYQVVNNPVRPGGCVFAFVHGGFPLPWNTTYNLVGSGCLAFPLTIINPVIDRVSFSLDVVFYVAVGLAVIQLYRGITGRTITARSLLASKMT
jgi:hypothetical protein